MLKYVVKRIIYMFITIFCIATATFFLMRSIPGDPLSSMAQTLPEQTKANYYAKYGLDKPLFTQYLMYMKNLLHGDRGNLAGICRYWWPCSGNWLGIGHYFWCYCRTI